MKRSLLRPDLVRSIQSEAMKERLFSIQEMALSSIESLSDQLDPQMQGWSLIGGSSLDRSLDSVPGDLSELRRRSINAYYRDPHGRSIIRTLVKFIIGKGTVVDFHEKDKEALTHIIRWWRWCSRINRWFSFQKEFVRRTFRDGEVFVRKFPQNDGSPLRLRFIDPDKVPDDGIITDPDDVETVLAYRIATSNGKFIEVDASEIIHYKYDVDRNVKRGRPVLESMLKNIARYEKWVEARMVLNIVRSSVALVREVQGSTTDLSRLRTAQRSSSQTGVEADRAKMLRPGTIITASPGVKYTMLSPDLDARDAAQDGRTILLSLAAAAGLPDVFVTADYSQANFASTVVSQNPAIREFEDNENSFSEPFSDIITWFLEDGIRVGAIPREVVEKDGTVRPINLDFSISYPPLIKRDLRQETEAWEVMHSNGIVSKRTWALNMGLDPDEERKLIAEEQETKPPEASRSNTRRAPKRVEDRRPREDVLVSADTEVN